jgi:UDP-N-acetylglucosamine diphosphorylase / glucose-1-phosphate thymidylyltransferase / UDP-N-acetylgalactosamine diphosphorylase / glucosamine-1-phosphate N-acetyltransferase / galactosamine-1-phosphate N-acetyltransferase
VHLHPGCVLDASRGPVMLETGVSIGANSVVQGPCWLGPGTQVAPLSLIGPGTSIGPMCKVAGEIANSVILGFSNKAHYGFLGDSYLGQWVNLGAGTTTSNMKNTYGQISVKLGPNTVASGRRFLGSVIGDHTKTAIGTRLMTGTYVGYCSSLATTAPPPRCVPSFTFLTDAGPQPYDMAKAASVAATVYARRSLPWTPADDQMMRFAAEQAHAVETCP